MNRAPVPEPRGRSLRDPRILREHLRLYGLGAADGTLNAKGYWQFTGGA